jgi:hypothetical protein
MAFLPAAESLRFGFAVAGDDGDPDCPLDSAQRFRCASPMRFRAAALSFRSFCLGGSEVVTGLLGLPANIWRISAI